MQANETREMEAACHCGTVRFRVKLTDGFNTARRCTCSYCRMRGAVAVSTDVGGITFDAGEEALTVYRAVSRDLPIPASPQSKTT
jgi:hypothetical protein